MNANIKKQIKLTPKKISNWLTTVIIVLTMAILIYISLFLYKNFYQTITEAKEILILREKVALDTVSMEKFNLIIEKLTKKTTPKIIGSVNNPFP